MFNRGKVTFYRGEAMFYEAATTFYRGEAMFNRGAVISDLFYEAATLVVR